MLVEFEALIVPAVRRPGRPVGANSDQTRRTILCAARDVIAEHGYRAATFQQIALRAGVSRPTLHYYFATREQLYEVLLADVRAEVARCAAEATLAGSLLRQLEVFIAEMHRLGGAEPALMGLVVTARVDHRGVLRHEAAAAVVSTVHAFFDAVVVDAVRRGELAFDTDAHAVADLLGALFWGLVFHAGFISGADGAPEIARQLLRMVGFGLLDTPEPASVDA